MPCFFNINLDTFEKCHLLFIQVKHDALKKRHLISYKILIAQKLKCPNYALFYNFLPTIKLIMKT